MLRDAKRIVAIASAERGIDTSAGGLLDSV
jgi:hypothetical protein